MDDFKQVYSEFLAQIENRISSYVPQKEPSSLYEPYKYIMAAGGKRIRPALTMIAAGAVGADPTSGLDSGVAIEILHNFTLLHDDIMDKSPIRRGKPTVHTKWNEAVAILTGDMMVGWAYNLLPKPGNHKRSGEIHSAFTSGLIEVCEGQAYDMDFNTKKDVTIDDYLLMIGKKTAKILETCAVVGAHCGLAGLKQTDALKNFAYNLGIAFQIQDDLLDIIAEEKELGKKPGKDIVEGKKTILIVKALEAAGNTNDKELLDEFYRNNGLPEEYIPEMKKMLDRLGVLEFAGDEARKYFGLAKGYLDMLCCNYYGEMLEWLTDSLINRKY